MAIRDFKSDSDGEWYVANGDFAGVEDLEAVGQSARIRCGMFLGECFLDESLGVNYVDVVLVKNPDPLLVRAEFARQLARVPDVTDVVGAQLVIEEGGTRNASIEYAVDTIYSEQPLSGAVGTP